VAGLYFLAKNSILIRHEIVGILGKQRVTDETSDRDKKKQTGRSADRAGEGRYSDTFSGYGD
jgi:hypothetical protein